MARYVRLYMTEKATNYGYHLFEFEVMGLGGLTKRPVNYGENLALNKNVTVSSLSNVWWLYKDGVKDETTIKASNAVDGNSNTSWASDIADGEWMYVDLEKPYNIGRVVLKWNTDAGKVYDIQTSADAKSWKTVYRKQDGIKEESIDVLLYATGVRYVRVYAYARTTISSGISVKELEVYAAAKNKFFKIEPNSWNISFCQLTHIMTVNSESYQHPILTKYLYRKFVDIQFNFLFHSTATFAIIVLLFKIYGCVSVNVKYIFIRYGVSSKTFQ